MLQLNHVEAIAILILFNATDGQIHCIFLLLKHKGFTELYFNVGFKLS